MKNNIAVLGPKDTFSDYAAQKFLKNHPNINAKISYHKTIRKVFEDLVAGNSQIAVVPIENMLEGFVGMTLDALFEFPVKIAEELILPVQFSFLSKFEHSKINKIFTHNMAEKQCLEFLEKFPNVQIIYTDSNIDSFEKLNEFNNCGAIVPSHIFNENEEKYKYSVKNIADNPNNNTRFFVLRSDRFFQSLKYGKTSVVIFDNDDTPGILLNIAKAFASRGVNMTSIISRPTKQSFGKYHFFIDINGSIQNESVQEALAEIGENYPVKILGCYKSANE